VKCLPGFLRCIIYLVHQFKSLRKIIPQYLGDSSPLYVLTSMW